MKLFIPLSLALFFSTAVFSQETISIPDVAFEEALIDLDIDTNGLNGSILVSDAKYVTNLNIHDPENNRLLPKVHSKIKSLKGIEHFTNLKRLICFGNEIEELDLSNNKELTFLNCGQNKITKLNVSNSPNLFFLSCDSNQLTSLNLGNKPKLVEIYCNSNRLSQLDLKGCTSLETIDASSNNLKEIVVNEAVFNNIPEGWYKDEKTAYSATGEVQLTPETTTTEIVEELPKTPVYDENFKRSVVAEYEKSVLNEQYLQQKKEEIQRKHNIDINEISNWINEYGKLKTIQK